MAVKDWSTTAASNITSQGPSGGSNMDEGMDPSAVNNGIRDIMAQVASQLGHVNFKGADIASATPDLSAATGWYVDITGTTAITALGTVAAGKVYILQFDGILTFTHNGTSLILPGAENITTAAGDMAVMISEGSGNWRCLHYRTAVSSQIETPWTTYTATFTAFGTLASQSMWWKRVGDTLFLRGNWVSGTLAGSEARMSLPNSITSDATKVPAIQLCGSMVKNATGAIIYTVLIESNVGYVTFGFQTAGAAGLTKQNGSSLGSNGDGFSLLAQVPITDW
jgi:hypothetical protein